MTAMFALSLEIANFTTWRNEMIPYSRCHISTQQDKALTAATVPAVAYTDTVRDAWHIYWASVWTSNINYIYYAGDSPSWPFIWQ